jgi:hypothetical protein
MNDIYDVLEHVLKDNKGASSKKIQEIMFMTYGYSYEDTRRAQEALKKADGSIARPNYWVDKGNGIPITNIRTPPPTPVSMQFWDKSINDATAQDWDAVRPDISEPNDATDPLSYQVGGEHYTKKKIQPVEYIHANEMDYMDGAIVKYISRWRDKGGVQDLQKIKQCVDLIIKLNKL